MLFSDLVGSTALSERMDPEDLREVISAYQTCIAEVVRRFDGFIAKYMGDGVLVYFGYPEAHEDDPERAVRAGLELVAEVGGLKTHASLQTRVGIAVRLDGRPARSGGGMIMNRLMMTSHAAVRMAQRSISMKDSELIVLIGTEVDDGYFVRIKDYHEVERDLKKLLQRLRRVVGKRLVVAEGRIVTAYHASKTCHRQTLRNAHECEF